MSNTTNMCINVHLEFNELHLGYIELMNDKNYYVIVIF